MVLSGCGDTRATWKSPSCKAFLTALSGAMRCEVDLSAPCKELAEDEPIQCGTLEDETGIAGIKAVPLHTVGTNTCAERRTRLFASPKTDQFGDTQLPTAIALVKSKNAKRLGGGADPVDFKCVTPGGRSGKDYPGALNDNCQDPCSDFMGKVTDGSWQPSGKPILYEPTLDSDGTSLLTLWNTANPSDMLKKHLTFTNREAAFNKEDIGKNIWVTGKMGEVVKFPHGTSSVETQRLLETRNVFWRTRPPKGLIGKIKSVEPNAKLFKKQKTNNENRLLGGKITVATDDGDKTFANPEKTRDPSQGTLKALTDASSVWEVKEYIHNFEQMCTSASVSGVPTFLGKQGKGFVLATNRWPASEVKMRVTPEDFADRLSRAGLHDWQVQSDPAVSMPHPASHPTSDVHSTVRCRLTESFGAKLKQLRSETESPTETETPTQTETSTETETPTETETSTQTESAPVDAGDPEPESMNCDGSDPPAQRASHRDSV